MSTQKGRQKPQTAEIKDRKKERKTGARRVIVQGTRIERGGEKVKEEGEGEIDR